MPRARAGERIGSQARRGQAEMSGADVPRGAVDEAAG